MFAAVAQVFCDKSTVEYLPQFTVSLLLNIKNVTLLEIAFLCQCTLVCGFSDICMTGLTAHNCQFVSCSLLKVCLSLVSLLLSSYFLLVIRLIMNSSSLLFVYRMLVSYRRVFLDGCTAS